MVWGLHFSASGSVTDGTVNQNIRISFHDLKHQAHLGGKTESLNRFMQENSPV